MNSNLFIIKNDTTSFKKKQIVKYITCTYSGQCHLVADIHNDLNREWLMYYDLYPVDKDKLDRFHCYRNDELQALADEIVLKNQV